MDIYLLTKIVLVLAILSGFVAGVLKARSRPTAFECVGIAGWSFVLGWLFAFTYVGLALFVVGAVALGMAAGKSGFAMAQRARRVIHSEGRTL